MDRSRCYWFTSIGGFIGHFLAEFHFSRLACVHRFCDPRSSNVVERPLNESEFTIEKTTKLCSTSMALWFESNISIIFSPNCTKNLKWKSYLFLVLRRVIITTVCPQNIWERIRLPLSDFSPYFVQLVLKRHSF